MPVPKKINKAIKKAIKLRVEVKAKAQKRRRREDDVGRAQAEQERKAKTLAPAAAKAVFVWLVSQEAKELRRLARPIGSVTLLGPTWGSNGKSAPALHSGAWRVSLHPTRPALLVGHRFHPMAGFQKEITTEAELIALLPGVVLIKLADALTSGKFWRTVKAELGDRAALRARWEEAV